jgi:glycosyltransferase 2 family protein
MKKKLIISLAVGVLLSSAALYLAFRNVPLVDLMVYMRTIDYVWVLPAALLVIIGFVLRVVRWRVILSITEKVSFSQAYHPLMIGFMLNCILPGRVGEAARPLILRRRQAVPFATGLATVAAERLLDAAFMIVFLGLALAAIPGDSSLHVTFGSHQLNKETLDMLGKNFIKLCILLLAGALFVAFDNTRSILKRMVHAMPDIILIFSSDPLRERFRRSVSLRINRLLDHAGEGLSLFKHPCKMGVCVGITILIWFLSAVSYYIMAFGCPGVNLSLYEFSIVMVIICFFIALPSVPGFWGVWEAGGVFALSLFGVSSQTAAGFTLANHAVQMFPVILMGLLSAAALSVNIWKISYGAELR